MAISPPPENRNNSLFDRSQWRATVGDVYTSLIHATELGGGDAFHNLTALMRHLKAVADQQSDWPPWTYRQTLARESAASVT